MSKDRYLFWRSYYDALRLLCDADAGRLVRAMCAYAFDEEEPDLSDSPTLMLAWTMVSGEIRESVENGRRKAEGGRRSGATRRGRGKGKAPSEHTSEHTSEQCSEDAPNVGKYVSTYGGGAPSPDAQAHAAARRLSDDELDAIVARIDRGAAEG